MDASIDDALLHAPHALLHDDASCDRWKKKDKKWVVTKRIFFLGRSSVSTLQSLSLPCVPFARFLKTEGFIGGDSCACVAEHARGECACVLWMCSRALERAIVCLFLALVSSVSDK